MRDKDRDELLQRIVSDLDSDSEVARCCAIRGLTALRDPRVCPILRSLAVNDPSTQVRASAALALGILDDAESEGLLRHLMLNDSEGWVRHMAAASLGLLSYSIKLAHETMLACVNALKDPDWHVVLAAVATLYRTHAKGVEQDAKKALFHLLNHPEWYIRWSVVETLWKLGWADERVLYTCEQLLQDAAMVAEQEWWVEHTPQEEGGDPVLTVRELYQRLQVEFT